MQCATLTCVIQPVADGSVRDVTPRYVKSYNNYTAKARAPSKKNTDWFAALLMPFHRTFELVGLVARGVSLLLAQVFPPEPGSRGAEGIVGLYPQRTIPYVDRRLQEPSEVSGRIAEWRSGGFADLESQLRTRATFAS